jgi:hypothetical protein
MTGMGWIAKFRLEGSNGWIAPIAVVPGRLAVAPIQTFAHRKQTLTEARHGSLTALTLTAMSRLPKVLIAIR